MFGHQNCLVYCIFNENQEKQLIKVLHKHIRWELNLVKKKISAPCVSLFITLYCYYYDKNINKLLKWISKVRRLKIDDEIQLLI